MVQPPLEHWLASVGPGLGQVVGGEVAVGAVGPSDIAVDSPVLDEHFGFEETLEAQPLSSPSRRWLLNDSIQALGH